MCLEAEFSCTKGLGGQMSVGCTNGTQSSTVPSQRRLQRGEERKSQEHEVTPDKYKEGALSAFSHCAGYTYWCE